MAKLVEISENLKFLEGPVLSVTGRPFDHLARPKGAESFLARVCHEEGDDP